MTGDRTGVREWSWGSPTQHLTAGPLNPTGPISVLFLCSLLPLTSPRATQTSVHSQAHKGRGPRMVTGWGGGEGAER